jgi:hypothetical protein
LKYDAAVVSPSEHQAPPRWRLVPEGFEMTRGANDSNEVKHFGENANLVAKATKTV